MVGMDWMECSNFALTHSFEHFQFRIFPFGTAQRPRKYNSKNLLLSDLKLLRLPNSNEQQQSWEDQLSHKVTLTNHISNIYTSTQVIHYWDYHLRLRRFLNRSFKTNSHKSTNRILHATSIETNGNVWFFFFVFFFFKHRWEQSVLGRFCWHRFASTKMGPSLNFNRLPMKISTMSVYSNHFTKTTETQSNTNIY